MSKYTDTQRLDFLLQWGEGPRFGVGGGPVDITVLDLGGVRYRAGTERDALDQAMDDHPHMVRPDALGLMWQSFLADLWKVRTKDEWERRVQRVQEAMRVESGAKP